MVNKILVKNDFLSKEDLLHIVSYLKDVEWVSQSSNNTEFTFGMNYCDHESFFNNYILGKIIKTFEIKSCELQRIYFNSQSFYQSGYFHTDGCDVTALIYISQYDDEWGGITQIKDNNNKYYFIIPKQSRIVLFPGNWLHKGYSFSYEYCPNRISLAYKLNNVKI